MIVSVYPRLDETKDTNLNEITTHPELPDPTKQCLSFDKGKFYLWCTLLAHARARMFGTLTNNYVCGATLKVRVFDVKLFSDGSLYS